MEGAAVTADHQNAYELPAKADCIGCDGRGWFRNEDDVDERCPCWQDELVLNGPPEVGIYGRPVVDDDWQVMPHPHKWVRTLHRTYCYWCHEVKA